MTPDMFAAEIERRLPELVRDGAHNRMTYLTGLAREFQDHIVGETIKTVLSPQVRVLRELGSLSDNRVSNTTKFFLPWK